MSSVKQAVFLLLVCISISLLAKERIITVRNKTNCIQVWDAFHKHVYAQKGAGFYVDVYTYRDSHTHKKFFHRLELGKPVSFPVSNKDGIAVCDPGGLCDQLVLPGINVNPLVVYGYVSPQVPAKRQAHETYYNALNRRASCGGLRSLALSNPPYKNMLLEISKKM